MVLPSLSTCPKKKIGRFYLTNSVFKVSSLQISLEKKFEKPEQICPSFKFDLGLVQ